MKLEVGMYVRTKNGMVAKIIDKRDISGSLHREEIVFILDNGNKLALHSQKVIKTSHNIIDLIEVGDYVNGEKVGEVIRKEMYHFGDGIIIKNETGEDIYSNFRYSKYANVETIVTKEQFESIKYSLEGECEKMVE